MAKSTSIYIVSLYRVTLIDMCNKNSTVGILQSWDGVLDLMIEDEEVWRRIKRCRMQARTHTHAPSDARERSGERHLTSRVTVGSIVKLKLTAEKTLLFQKAENLESHSPLPCVDKLKGLKTTRLNGSIRLVDTTDIPPPTLPGPLNGRLLTRMRSMEGFANVCARALFFRRRCVHRPLFCK
jgi:hypothetical protein